MNRKLELTKETVSLLTDAAMDQVNAGMSEPGCGVTKIGPCRKPTRPVSIAKI